MSPLSVCWQNQWGHPLIRGCLLYVNSRSMSTLRTLLPLILVSISIFAKAGEIGFDTIDEFISTLPEAKGLNVSGSGSLDTSGSAYHAQLVQLEGNYRLQQIFVFRAASNGKFVLMDQSRRMDSMGGSGFWEVRNIEFKNHSLYITFTSHWHECSSSFTSQFQLRKGKLVMIGRESVEENINKDLVVESSANLLTGSAYTVSGNQETMYSVGGGKSSANKYQYKVLKEILPFSEFDGTPWKSPIYKKHPVC